MPEESTNRAYEAWRDAALQFDYFMAGLSTAIVGYLASQLKPSRIGCNPGTLELVAFLLLVGSAFAAFKKIERMVHFLRVGHAHLLRAETLEFVVKTEREKQPLFRRDSGEAVAIDVAKKEVAAAVLSAQAIEKASASKAVAWYNIRNILLFSGFLAILLAKVWQAYQ